MTEFPLEILTQLLTSDGCAGYRIVFDDEDDIYEPQWQGGSGEWHPYYNHVAKNRYTSKKKQRTIAAYNTTENAVECLLRNGLKIDDV